MSKIQEEAQKRLDELQARAKELQDKIQEAAKDVQDRIEDSVQDARERREAAGEFSKKIWLAGLGAYGRAYDEASEVVERTSSRVRDNKMPELFEELVAKGEEIEAKTLKRIEEVRNSQLSIEDRINQMRESLGFGKSRGTTAKKAPAKKKAAAKKKAPAKKKAAAKKKAPAKKKAVRKKAAKKK